MKVTTKKQLEIEQRRKTVAENILSGLNYRDIGGALDVSIGTISSDFSVIIGRLQREQTTAAEEIITLEIRRLDRALNAIFAKVVEGDAGAIDLMLKIMNQRAKYLGLYAPERRELSGLDGGPIEVADIEAIRQKRWDADPAAANPHGKFARCTRLPKPPSRIHGRRCCPAIPGPGSCVGPRSSSAPKRLFRA